MCYNHPRAVQMCLTLQKRMYREQMELMLQNYVFPLLNSPMGYLRARVSEASHLCSAYVCRRVSQRDRHLCVFGEECVDGVGTGLSFLC